MNFFFVKKCDSKYQFVNKNKWDKSNRKWHLAAILIYTAVSEKGPKLGKIEDDQSGFFFVQKKNLVFQFWVRNKLMHT